MDAKLMEMISVLLSFEQTSAEALKPTINEAGNSIVKMFLSRIMWDSLKHATMLQTMLDVNSGKIVWEVDNDTGVELPH